MSGRLSAYQSNTEERVRARWVWRKCMKRSAGQQPVSVTCCQAVPISFQTRSGPTAVHHQLPTYR